MRPAGATAGKVIVAHLQQLATGSHDEAVVMADGHEPTIAEYNRILAAAREANRAELAAAGVVRERTWDTPGDGPRLLAVTEQRRIRGPHRPRRDDELIVVTDAPAGPSVWARWASSRSRTLDTDAVDEQHILDEQVAVAWSDEAIRQAERNARDRDRMMRPTPRSRGLGHVGLLAAQVHDLSRAAATASATPATSSSTSAAPVRTFTTPTARIHPVMLLELDRLGAFAPARLHAVLVALIADGHGWIDADAAADALTSKGGPWYIYGRRRLSEVLRAGDGIFWTRTRGRDNRLRIWIHSRARIIAHYGLKLTAHEVIIPVAELLAGDESHGRSREAAVKATIYAAAHAGRRRAHLPIARLKIADGMGLSKWRQRRYEQRRRIAVRGHIEIDGGYSDHRLAVLQQQRVAAWRHVDRRGMFGPRGGIYLAVRLPNSYTPNLQRYTPVESTRNRRRINAQAKRLSSSSIIAVWTNEAGPNDTPPPRQVFYDAGEHDRAIRQAGREIGRADAAPVYQTAPRRAGTRDTRPRVGVWRDLSRARYSEYMAVGLS